MKMLWWRICDVWFNWRYDVAAWYCRKFGHDYEVVCDVENGTEDIECTRCGHSQHFQF